MESVVVKRGKTADTPQWIAGGHQTYLRFQRFGKHPRDHSLCPYVVEREKKQRKQLFNPVRVSVYLAAVLHHRIESGSLSASLKKELIRGHLFWDNLKWRRGPPQAEISILDDENEASVFQDKSCTTIACISPFELGNTQSKASLQRRIGKKKAERQATAKDEKKSECIFYVTYQNSRNCICILIFDSNKAARRDIKIKNWTKENCFGSFVPRWWLWKKKFFYENGRVVEHLRSTVFYALLSWSD